MNGNEKIKLINRKFILNIILASILYYSFLPIMDMEVSFPFILISIINIFIWLLLSYSVLNKKETIILLLASIVCVALSYFHVFQIVYSVLILIIVTLIPIFIFIARRLQWFNDIKPLLNVFIHVFGVLSYLNIIFVLTVFADEYIELLPFSELQIINFIIISNGLIFGVFIVNLLINLVPLVKGSNNTWFVKVSPWLIAGCLIIPDVIVSEVMYGFYFDVFTDKEYSFFDFYYYSFSLHFLTPISDVGELIQLELNKKLSGQFTYIFHMLSVRMVDITVIATLSSTFTKFFKSDS
ncbi:hypothetical protein [Aquibacillus rhizosphaerae]|uniref:Uncharacterized protein n=1 Tax=Aquibacillus rhizosphaerae TaxID=3051431 RepID=A0ABT7LA94_9BACI|nr:hypothetical protein [Aquibacillus sp. LR5S19]MDL4842790.1 hypothetical protein [Aquibacillus sp. LR5S19]